MMLKNILDFSKYCSVLYSCSIYYFYNGFLEQYNAVFFFRSCKLRLLGEVGRPTPFFVGTFFIDCFWTGS